MDTQRLNLQDLETLRYLELGYPIHEAVRHSVLWPDVHVGKTPSLQEIVGQPGALSQDAFDALILRQGGIGKFRIAVDITSSSKNSSVC